jgi:hypothetical protein
MGTIPRYKRYTPRRKRSLLKRMEAFALRAALAAKHDWNKLKERLKNALKSADLQMEAIAKVVNKHLDKWTEKFGEIQ